MVFSSLEFVFFFLPISLAIYFLAPQRLRNTVLLLSSLCFYAWGAQLFVFVLFASIVANYCFGLLADAAVHSDRKQQRLVAIWGAVVSNLALLGYFKYANFFVAQVNSVMEQMGGEAITWVSIALPIGISFFTFQSMSYVLDIASGRSRALKNPVDFAMYVALFPQLIAGPIVRFHLIEQQLRSRPIIASHIAEGLIRFSYGLCKKVLVADPAGAFAEAIFGAPSGSMSSAMVWLGAISYSIQIYFDFSAYSDMAIGLGRVLGFRFPENFNNPYSATSITDFWRRWHITLSQWFRDYVYIPLGGSRTSSSRMYANLAIVFLLTGIWHGASWTFIAWGAYHGALLVVERIGGWRAATEGNQKYARRALTLLLVILGWVLFRAESFDQAMEFYSAMFFFNGFEISHEVFSALSNKNLACLLMASCVFFLPGSWCGYHFLTGLHRSQMANDQQHFSIRPFGLAFLLLLLLPYTVTQIASGTYSPFLYFRF